MSVGVGVLLLSDITLFGRVGSNPKGRTIIGVPYKTPANIPNSEWTRYSYRGI